MPDEGERCEWHDRGIDSCDREQPELHGIWNHRGELVIPSPVRELKKTLVHLRNLRDDKSGQDFSGTSFLIAGYKVARIASRLWHNERQKGGSQNLFREDFSMKKGLVTLLALALVCFLAPAAQAAGWVFL